MAAAVAVTTHLACLRRHMNQETTLQLLETFLPCDDTEGDFLRRTRQFVRDNPAFHRRETLAGHLTASAWIVNPEREQALLLHHGKLRRWLQPGGHIEDDQTLLAAALREAREETGLACRAVDTAVFDIDVHPIPARADEPAHLHYDIRFLLETAYLEQPEVSTESNAVRWFALEHILTMNCGPSIDRMVEKTRRLGRYS